MSTKDEMKRTIKNTLIVIKQILLSTHYSWQQFIIILLVAGIFIFIPQLTSDWELNTRGFWSDIPRTYLNNPNFVYPPWGLILLLPYWLIHAVGARVLSVITIGWLSYKRKWPFHLFFAVVLSPCFAWTMSFSNMDILVIVLPILLWEFSKGKKWETITRGISLSVLLVKPQGTFLLILYLLWINRREWKKILTQLVIVALFVIPISFVGSPPLLFQWLHNIIYPSLQNQYYWSINNISLTAKIGFWAALVVLLFTLFILFLFVKARIISWEKDQTIASLLLFSMYLSPYTSQQSYPSGLAFIPSWLGIIYQWVGVNLNSVIPGLNSIFPLWMISVGLVSLIIYSFLKRKNEKSFDLNKILQQSNQ